MFALQSLHPEYSQIIQPFIAWAPVAFNTYASWPLTNTFCPALSLYRAIGGPYLFAQKWAAIIQQIVCRPLPPTSDLCADAYISMFGASNRMNRSRISVYMHFSPDEVSNWEYVHICLTQSTDSFTQFDYGSALANQAVYGTPTAPLFPLQNISSNATIILMHGATDIVSTLQDTARLFAVLNGTGANVVDHLVAADPFNHVDFTLGMGSGALVNGPTLGYLDQYW